MVIALAMQDYLWSGCELSMLMLELFNLMGNFYSAALSFY